MKIDGKTIAAHIFHDLHQKILSLKQKNITPHLAIILVGDNPASISYVNRKKMKAEELGCKATIVNYEVSITNEKLRKKIKQLNNDNTVHGIIVQRPLPTHIDTHAINQAVAPQKDVDAFHNDTPFDMPLAKAAIMLLKNVHQQEEIKLLLRHGFYQKK
jgi:methylenetetrahydrofolate dehydrogenase (NADP+) / methenyltetrahydrofolate cyclohydrolase